MVSKQGKKKKTMITISIEKEVAELLEGQGHMHDTYSTVIRRLIESNGKPHERGTTGEYEQDVTGDRNSKKG